MTVVLENLVLKFTDCYIREFYYYGVGDDSDWNVCQTSHSDSRFLCWQGRGCHSSIPYPHKVSKITMLVARSHQGIAFANICRKNFCKSILNLYMSINFTRQNLCGCMKSTKTMKMFCLMVLQYNVIKCGQHLCNSGD